MRYYIYFIFTMLLITGLSCTTDNGVSPDDQAKELTQKGWESFGSKNYQAALQQFLQALDADSAYTEAYNGAGWSSARLTNLADAISYFNQILSMSSSNSDAQAGLAFVYSAQKEYNLAVSSAKSALNSNSNWNFKYDSSINYKDLYLILAACYFGLGNLSQSLEQVEKLNPTFSADVTTYQGKADLGEEIERLRGVV